MHFDNVYYIKIGTKEQPDVEHYAITKNKVLIGYDKQVKIEDLVKLVNESREKHLDPEDKIIIDKWKNLKVENSKAEANVQTALRRFFLARPGHDCFCTFFKDHLYYGMPSDYDEITETCEIDGLADECKFRERAITWIPDPMLNPILNTELDPKTVYDSSFKFHHLSGMLQKMRAMRATLSRLDDDKNADIIDQKRVFELTVDGQLSKELIGPLSKAIDDCNDGKSGAGDELRNSMDRLIRNIGPNEFEVFVDIWFLGKGYRRCSELGGIQEAVDMEYLTPDMKDVEFCQVKSVISPNELTKVMSEIEESSIVPSSCICHIAHHAAEGSVNCLSKKLDDAISTYNKNSKVRFKALPLSTMLKDACKMKEIYLFVVGVYIGREKAIAWWRNCDFSFIDNLD